MQCPQCNRTLARGVWCIVHGTVNDDGETDVRFAVETPAPRRQREGAHRTGRAWSETELQFVQDYKDTMSHEELARSLSRTAKGVMNLLSSRGWSKRRVAGGEYPPPPARRPHQRWTDYEDGIAGDTPVDALLRRRASLLPGRSRRAILTRLRYLNGAGARGGDGMLNVLDVARGYQTSRRRVRHFVENGTLPATRSSWGDWQIDPKDCERIAAQLRAPKRTHKETPPDLGDYAARYAGPCSNGGGG